MCTLVLLTGVIVSTIGCRGSPDKKGLVTSYTAYCPPVGPILELSDAAYKTGDPLWGRRLSPFNDKYGLAELVKMPVNRGLELLILLAPILLPYGNALIVVLQ